MAARHCAGLAELRVSHRIRTVAAPHDHARRNARGPVLRQSRIAVAAFTSRESILWWVITSHRRGRREYGEVRDSGRYPGLAWIELRAPSDSSRLLRDVAGGR
jgi:hypothetical protein